VTDGVELLERCRAGDRDAFRALVTHWGDRALAVAATLTGDRARAHRAVRDALLACWRELPSTHSERAFRPWLMALVAEAAGPAADARAAALLEARGGERAGAAALKEARAVDAADDAVRAILEAAPPGLALPQTFFDDALAARMTDAAGIEVRRIVATGARAAWGAMTDPNALPKWVSAEDVRANGSLRAGARIRARGRIADKRGSRDATLVTRADEERVLAWTTRARPVRLPGVIEFRWSISCEPDGSGTQLVHRLHGIAFPPGVAGVTLRRAYAKIADAMQLSMHRGLERLAALISSAR
jgi:RNA polymerase sigma-70 factor (ECF subfamily)